MIMIIIIIITIITIIITSIQYMKQSKNISHTNMKYLSLAKSKYIN